MAPSLKSIWENSFTIFAFKIRIKTLKVTLTSILSLQNEGEDAYCKEFSHFQSQ
jgi:hypothetical protein